MKYLVLLRGINVGGKNRVKMAELKQCFESLGFQNVSTYIQSGNIILESNQSAQTIAGLIENTLPKKFKLDSDIIKVFVYSRRQFTNIIKKAPPDFGENTQKYYYDFIFLNDINSKKAIKEFSQNQEVDSIWAGLGVIYYRRLASQRS